LVASFFRRYAMHNCSDQNPSNAERASQEANQIQVQANMCEFLLCSNGLRKPPSLSKARLCLTCTYKLSCNQSATLFARCHLIAFIALADAVALRGEGENITAFCCKLAAFPFGARPCLLASCTASTRCEAEVFCTLCRLLVGFGMIS
jgi:hypothetical protein